MYVCTMISCEAQSLRPSESANAKCTHAHSVSYVRMYRTYVSHVPAYHRYVCTIRTIRMYDTYGTYICIHGRLYGQSLRTSERGNAKCTYVHGYHMYACIVRAYVSYVYIVRTYLSYVYIVRTYVSNVPTYRRYGMYGTYVPYALYAWYVGTYVCTICTVSMYDTYGTYMYIHDQFYSQSLRTSENLNATSNHCC